MNNPLDYSIEANDEQVAVLEVLATSPIYRDLADAERRASRVDAALNACFLVPIPIGCTVKRQDSGWVVELERREG